MNEEIIVKVGADISGLGRDLNAASREVSGFGSRLGGIMKAAGAAVVAGTAVAGAAFIGFSKNAVTAAANAAAMNSQFAQVFDGLETEATKSLESISKETGIFSNRLKASYTQMAAFAKTTGMDTADALSLTERATLAAADSAAFYDRSIEDVSESLQSFLKGNYENDAALGISATETTRNAKANELYGQSFKDLSEAQKQLTLLAMVEDGNKLSGALGQAAREADGFENITGNLKQAWQDLLVQFGTPILPIVTEWIIAIANAIKNFDATPYINAFTAIWNAMKTFVDFALQAYDTIKSTFSDGGNILEGLITAETVAQVTGYLKTAYDVAKTYFTAIMEVAKYAWGMIKEYIVPALAEIVKFVGNKLSELKAFWDENGQQIMSAVKNVWNGIKAVVDFVMPAILFIVKSVWNNIKGVIDGVLNVIMGLVKVFAGLFTGDFRKMWEGVKQIFSGAIEAVWNAFNLLLYGRLLKAGKALFTGLRTAFANGWTALVGQTKSGIKFVTSSFDDMVRAVRTTFGKVVSAIKTKWDEAMTFLRNIDLRQIGDDIISGLVNGIKAGFTKVKTAVSNLAKLIPDTVSNLLGIKSPSRVMMALGNWTGVGMAKGIEGTISTNRKVMNELSTVIQGAAKDNAKAIADLAKKSGEEEATITKQAQQQINEIHAKAKDGKRDLTAAEVRKIAKIEADADAAIVKAKKAHASDLAKIDAESGKQRLDAIQTFIDRKKRLEEISLIDEVNIWRKAVEQFKNGTDEKLDAQEKYRDALARVNTEITNINETYANKMSEINKRLKDEELALTKAYQDALTDRTKSLMSFAGLFDAFAVEVKQSGAELLSNLQSQVDGFKTWQSEITKLSSRAIDDGLLAELRAMGPDALPQLIALNSLTDEQLSQYSDLYREKAELARTQAEAELVGMKDDTKKQIDALRATANAELAVLQSEWVAKIKGVTQATTTEFKTLTQIGKQAGQNLLDGLASMESSLVAQARAIAQAVNAALQTTLGGSAPALAYSTPSASASSSGATRATGKTATTPGTIMNGVNVTISAKDVAEFNSVVDFFEALPQQIRKN